MSANHGVLASRTAIKLRVSRGNFYVISFEIELILVKRFLRAECRIHSAFVPDKAEMFLTDVVQECTKAIACIAHKFKWFIPVWGNQDWSLEAKGHAVVGQGSVMGQVNVVFSDLLGRWENFFISPTLKVTDWSSCLKVIFSPCTSIKALAVLKNGLPKINWTLGSGIIGLVVELGIVGFDPGCSHFHGFGFGSNDSNCWLGCCVAWEENRVVWIWFLPSVCDAGQYDRVGNTAGNTTLFNRFYGSRELELEMSACREVGSNHIFQFSNIGSDTTELVKAREAMMWTCLEKLFDSTQASLNELIKSLFEIGNFVPKICRFRRWEKLIDEFSNEEQPIASVSWWGLEQLAIVTLDAQKAYKKALFIAKSSSSGLQLVLLFQSQPLKTLGNGVGLPTWHLYSWGGNSRVVEMILARVSRGFAGRRYGTTSKLYLGFVGAGKKGFLGK
ncbi:hypothetical protein Tco_1291640 [Tanacetum coccineum]